MKLKNAMVFAAGLGTRLAPITNDKPKALVQICNKPLMWHVLKKLESLELEKVVVNTHHFADKLETWLNAQKFDFEIIISHEKELLDTAGGLAFASKSFDSDDILLYNVDIISNIDLNKMYEYHNQTDAMATLAVKNRKTSRYFLFDEEMSLVGWKNEKTNELILPGNNPKYNPLAFSGIHIIDKKLLSLLGEQKKQSLTPFYLEVSKQHSIKGYEHSDDYWFDCGSLEALKKTEKYLKNH